MKALPQLLFFASLLALAGCGKGNESGRNSNASRSCVAFGPNGQCSAYATINNINSNYSYGGVSLNTVQAENPCILSNSWGQTNLNRQAISTRISMPTIVTNGDMYVGVTSYGDVAAIIGNGTNQPLFVAYLCPRAISGQGTLYPQITIGAYTNCAVKYITSANMAFPDGSQANFRAPVYGSSRQVPFSFCQQ